MVPLNRKAFFLSATPKCESPFWPSKAHSSRVWTWWYSSRSLPYSVQCPGNFENGATKIWSKFFVRKSFQLENFQLQLFNSFAVQFFWNSHFSRNFYPLCLWRLVFSPILTLTHTYMQTMYLWIFFSRWVEYRVRVIKVLDKRNFNIILKNGWR